MIALWSGDLKKGWIGIHEINGVIYGRTGFGIKTVTIPRQWRQKACWRFLRRNQSCNGARKPMGILHNHR
jgi:hypothetical protein